MTAADGSRGGITPETDGTLTARHPFGIRLVKSDKSKATPYGGALKALCTVAARHNIAANPLQLAHGLALEGEPSSDDIVRAAKSIGMRARCIRLPIAERLHGAPAPAILQFNSGLWAILGAEVEWGKRRVVDPVSQIQEVLTVDEILARGVDALFIVKKSAAP